MASSKRKCGVGAWKEEENLRRQETVPVKELCIVCVYHPCSYLLLVGIVYMCCEIVECYACNGILFVYV